MLRMILGFSLLAALVGCAGPRPQPQPTQAPAPPTSTAVSPGVLAPPRTAAAATQPLLTAYLQAVAAALQAKPPILPLRDLDPERAKAQAIALGDEQVQSLLVDPQTRVPLRNEVFGVVPLRPSDMVGATAPCQTTTCYRVEIYNFALNQTVSVVVALNSERVVTLALAPNTQPDLPPALVAIATEIATTAPEVQQALGYAPEASQAVMANTKTSLNATRCERSLHLCVAPTFVHGDRALWAIVDLTDGQLVGVRWTNVGTTGPAVTEKDLQNTAVLPYCDTMTHVARDGWEFDYTLTSSDGLRISQVYFAGKLVIETAKLVDWHVNYSRTEGFGYSDAVGCPFFSQAAVVAVEPPTIEEVVVDGAVVGFTLEQEFWSELWPQPCNYYYEQAFTFGRDGSFRPAVASVGRGCGDDGTYRPVTRIALPETATFAGWNGNAWQPWPTEAWQAATDRQVGPEDAEYRIEFAAGGGFLLATGRGQFDDGGRGDQAFVFVTRQHADRDEGASDMLTIGPCCNTDYRQGPEQFIDSPPEAISKAPLVLWYVAQLKNDDEPGKEYCWAESILEQGVYTTKEYPCWSGPIFKPL